MTKNIWCVFSVHNVETRYDQEMKYPNVTSLYFAIPLAFNVPKEGQRMVTGGSKPQRMAVLNGEEILPKPSTP